MTVLRLLLRSGGAADLTRQKLDELKQSDVPVMLFLRRLARLALVEVTQDGCHETVLARDATPLPAAGELGAQHVTLNGTNRFLVFSSDVDSHDLGAAISAAVQQERLDSRWLNWQVPASVSIAVSLDEESEQHRYYTYLPLGAKASAPFAGHLNAPFFTNFARLDIDLDHPLNSLLLGHAATLALAAGSMLRRTGLDEAPQAVVDLLSWDCDQIEHLRRAALQTGSELAELPLVPTARAPFWASMNAAWRWPHLAAHVLTGTLAAETCDVRSVPYRV